MSSIASMIFAVTLAVAGVSAAFGELGVSAPTHAQTAATAFAVAQR